MDTHSSTSSTSSKSTTTMTSLHLATPSPPLFSRRSSRKNSVLSTLPSLTLTINQQQHQHNQNQQQQPLSHQPTSSPGAIPNRPAPLSHLSHLSSGDPRTPVTTEQLDMITEAYRSGPRCILPFLYLGSESNAANKEMMARLGVDLIINVAEEVRCPYEWVDGMEYVQLDVDRPGYTVSTTRTLTNVPVIILEPVKEEDNEDNEVDVMEDRGYASEIRRLSDDFKLKLATAVLPSTSSSPSSSSSLPMSESESTTTASTYAPSKYVHLPLSHNPENLPAHFETITSLIESARSSHKTILVHCQQGVSRSASMIIAYVMLKLQMSVWQAYTFAKAKAPAVCPNIGLMEQLALWENTAVKERGARFDDCPQLMGEDGENDMVMDESNVLVGAKMRSNSTVNRL